MTFPAIAASNTSVQGIADTHAVALPAGIAEGDLLVAAIGFAEAGATFGWPAGWTVLADAAISVGGQDVSFSAAYRVATGEEGDSLSVTSGKSARSAHQTWRITGAHGTPQIATETGGNTTGAASPPSLAPAWGAADTLWFALLATSAPRAHSAYPADYTNGTNAQTAGTTATHVALRTAQRELHAASEDPGSFTFGATSTAWVVATIAIGPATAGGDKTVAATGVSGEIELGTAAGLVGASIELVGAAGVSAIGAVSVASNPAGLAGCSGDGRVGSVEISLGCAARPVQAALVTALGSIRVRRSGWSPAGAAAAAWSEATGTEDGWTDAAQSDVAWALAAAVSDAWTPTAAANGEWSA